MQQLLRPSALARRLSRLLGVAYTADDVFEVVNDGGVTPEAMAGTLPLFRADQLIEVGAILTGADFKNFRHQTRPLREAVQWLRGTTLQTLSEAVEAGDIPSVKIDGVVHVHMPTVGKILRGVQS